MAKQKQDLKLDYEKEDQETVAKSKLDWTKRIVLDIPVWAIKEIDKEASRRGIARQALIKNWLVDRIDGLGKKQAG